MCGYCVHGTSRAAWEQIRTGRYSRALAHAHAHSHPCSLLHTHTTSPSLFLSFSCFLSLSLSLSLTLSLSHAHAHARTLFVFRSSLLVAFVSFRDRSASPSNMCVPPIQVVSLECGATTSTWLAPFLRQRQPSKRSLLMGPNTDSGSGTRSLP
jgi:hypothetical protein